MQNSRANWIQVSPMLCLQIREILLKGLSDCTLAFSQGIHSIHDYLKADCAKWKAERDSINNPRLTRTFDKWKADNFKLISSLVKSVMHPISRLRLESHVAVISLKELPSGFQVLSAETALIDSLYFKS
jgi:hypothetical protein